MKSSFFKSNIYVEEDTSWLKNLNFLSDSYIEWSKDEGIIDTLLSYEIYKGLNFFE
jgi:hypothetical protein